MNNESCMPANGNSLAISDVSIDFKHPFPNLVPESCPMIKKTVSNRRDTYVSVPKQMETSDIVSASCPKDSKFVLSEIECVKAKLEESGIKGVADKIDKVRPPSKLFRDSTDILKEIECSKAPHPDLDKISFLVAEHLRMDNKKDHGFQMMIRKKKKKKGKGLSSDILNVQSLISDEVKKYDYKEDTIYETNLHECKESFLQTTINETSFVPIPEKGYCSTAVKDKTREKSLHNQSEERSSTFCRDLFGSKNNSNNSPNEVVISESAEHNLSLLLPSPSEDLKVSSETFTMSPEISKLTTINEDHEDLRSNSLSKNLSKEMSVSEYKMTDSTDNNSPPNLKSNPIKNEVFSSNSSKTTKFSSEQLSSSVETKSVRNVREKYSTMKSRISNPSGGNSSSSTLRPSPLKKGSPFKRRYPDSKTLKPNSRSGLTLIKMAAASNPKLHSNSKTSLVRHPNLFSAKNLYYDERWMEKQKKGFTKWLNFILTPSDEVMDMSSHNKKTDAAKLWSACTKDVKVPRAPTREVMSFRAYTMEKEMNSLRISAVRLWQSPQVIKVITKLEIEIEKKKLYVRDDRCLNKDLGIKQSFLSLLLNYNPLWLRIGLETIYGEVLQVSGNSDIVRISRFIITRLLSNPSILETYSHPTVPHLYKPGHEEALKKFTLKMFLRLIFFLDFAKNNRLIKHDPCLFCKDSDFKMSRDLLVEFSKKFLACEGDITKHLRCIGYDVNHKQTIFDEFDYAVINFPTDVRCGARLCRVLELLLDGDYTSKLRIPAHSRLQKIHNVSIALKALTSSSAGLPKSIDSKDIVNGYVEKILKIARLLKSLKVHAVVKESPAASGLQFYEEKETNVPNEESEPTTKYVLKWARLVCAHYGIEIENLTVFLSKEEIMMNTTVSSVAMSNITTSIDDNRKANDELLNNEKKNFKTFLDKVNELGGVPILIRSVDMSNTIPDRKVTLTFLIYLASRLLDLFEEIHAAKKIQSTWRRTKKLREKRCLEEKYSTIDSKGS
ncbi:ASPM [Lepeophtheirus salmonis]|uniref:ASPM n=1 Tax=Lepeophtheirus salmonis TaxID=72036 RepID=A0A7R8CSD1_LEPSM|nr:ASPM [Lepeophtheirus salmonis]CAF2876248.1 ASPM [Lepeophtheirus salmonis]